MHRLKTAVMRAVPFFIVLVAVLVAVTAAAPTGSVLIVEDPDSGERYITQQVGDGTLVGLEYMHSVEKTRVYDEYRVSGTRLINTRMEFASYGWGLPSRVNVTNVNGTFVYDPPGNITELDSLSVSTGRIAGHKLTIGTHWYDLVRVTDGSDVRIHIEQRSLTDLFT